MTVEVSERSFEKTIECGLLRYGPDGCAGEIGGIREEAAPDGESPPRGYRKRATEEYDKLSAQPGTHLSKKPPLTS